MANETWWLGGARKHLALVSLYVLENNGVPAGTGLHGH